MAEIDDWDADYSDDKPALEKEFEGGFDDLETEKTVVPTSQPKVESTKVTATVPTNKKKKQLLKEAVERKEAEALAAAQLSPEQQKKARDEDERRRRELQEASDYEHSVALFGGGPKRVVDPAALNAAVLLKDSTEAGFTDLAKQVSGLVLQHAGSENYPIFLKEVAKQLTTPSEVTVEDVKGVIDALTATMNAKIKSEKGAKAGKKPVKKGKVSTDWSKNNVDMDDVGNSGGGAAYSEYDDFM